MVVSKIVSLFKGKAFKIALLVALFLTSLIIALAMLLGREAGTFVIRVQDGDLDKSIAITTGDPTDKTSYTSKLSAPAVAGFTDYSPEYFLEEGWAELDRIQKEYPGLYTVGDFAGATKNHADDARLANTAGCCLYVYTFYIVNTGVGQVGVNVSMNYDRVTKGLDKCIRIMTYAKDYYTHEPYIYQRPDEIYKEYDKYVRPPRAFAEVGDTSGIIFNDQHYNIDFQEGSNYLAYSIFFWIEGNDPDETTEIFGSTINFSVNVSVDMNIG